MKNNATKKARATRSSPKGAAVLLAVAMVGLTLVTLTPGAAALPKIWVLEQCAGHSVDENCYGLYHPGGDPYDLRGICLGVRLDDHCTGAQL